MEEKSNIKMTPKQKLENFWYHYKWHTIASVFAVFVLVIVVLQMCTKPVYDVYILYAGDCNISSVSEDGDLPQYNRVVSSLKKVCPDENGDGTVDVNLQKLYALTPSQTSELDSSDTASISLSNTDTEKLDSMLIVGKYYVCFLSEEIFKQRDEMYEGELFVPLSKYATDESIEYEYASERGIYLRSLPFGETIDLPGDTVVCLRTLNVYSTVSNSKEDKACFNLGEKVIKNILTYK